MPKRKSKWLKFFFGKSLLADAKYRRARDQWWRGHLKFVAVYTKALDRLLNDKVTCDTSVLYGGFRAQA